MSEETILELDVIIGVTLTHHSDGTWSGDLEPKCAGVPPWQPSYRTASVVEYSSAMCNVFRIHSLLKVIFAL